ncbi:hypothetical protein JCM33374_g1751 [Metschnikowia sp. JCM 33374]|nr:hypothetical protein JCM33374_g1751 [Metschnikowia sp. JCM 33374]
MPEPPGSVPVRQKKKQQNSPDPDSFKKHNLNLISTSFHSNKNTQEKVMTSPQTPTRASPKKGHTSSTGGSSARSRRKVLDEIFEENDKTYVISGTESESESDSEDESDLEIDIKDDLDAESLRRNVTLVDDSCIALKEEDKASEQSPKTTAESPKVETAAKKIQQFLLKHEIPRKVFHSLQGVVTLYLYTCGFSQYQIAWPLWGIFFSTSIFELVRLNVPAVNRAVLPWVKYFIRTRETNSCNGIVFYLAGVSLVLTFAAKDIAVTCILLLSWADTAASTVGRAYGRYTPQVARGKSLAGSLASFSTGVFVCYLFYGHFVPVYGGGSPGFNAWSPQTSHLNLHVYALAMGLVASVSEAIDVAGIDDNFTIPVLSSVFLSGLVRVFRA